MTDTDDADVEPETLRADLDAIKDAMGLEERYRGVTTLWLVFGVLVAVAAGLSQFVHARRLPPVYHSAIWLTVLGAGGYLGARGILGPVRRVARRSETPDVFLQFVAIYLASVPIQVTIEPLLASDDYVTTSIVVFGINLVVVGLGLVITSNSLKTYRIRRRDRLALYGGGAWIVALGAVLPHSAFLREWGYATFGGLYLAYAVASYAVLTGGAVASSGGDEE